MKNRVTVCLVVCFCMNLSLRAQDTALAKTLNFRDLTSTAINQTVAEATDNEKKIDFGDYDNDGDMDVVVAVAFSDFGQRRNKLYRNDDGVLNEVSGEPIIPEFETTDVSRAAMFNDFDNDGFIDLVIANDSNSGTGSNSAPGKTKYLRNVAGQFFVNESDRLDGLTGSAGDALAADLDQNGLADVVLINHPNVSQDSMALNGINGQAPGQFEVVTSTHLPNDTQYGGVIHAADMNGDGQLDLLMGNSLSGTDFIYFNNNNDEGSGTGDFRYGGASEKLTLPGPGKERMMVPGDFNGDGRVDFYYANIGPSQGPRPDLIQINIGNNALNVPDFEVSEMPNDLNSETNRVEVQDLDGDGRPDLVVVSEERRPFIYRNASENGDISFVEWTPVEFQAEHTAWGVGVSNLTATDSTDVMIGAMQDDYLFEKIPSSVYAATDLTDGQLPELVDLEPIQVVGEAGYDSVSFETGQIPEDARVSILLRSNGDLILTAIAGATPLIADRPGHATDQWLQFEHPGGQLQISITLQSPSFDGNGDGLVNLLDVSSFVDCLNGGPTDCEPFDCDDDGLVTLLDVNRFVDRLMGSPVDEAYSLELLVRTD